MTEPLFRATSHIPGGGWNRKPVTVHPSSDRNIRITIGDSTLVLQKGQAHRLADAIIDAYEENHRDR